LVVMTAVPLADQMVVPLAVLLADQMVVLLVGTSA
jgi:hypothetical protein